jgi:ABC-2 type transport system permease protein
MRNLLRSHPALSAHRQPVLQPGSPSWLLHHELRLTWRTVAGARIWILLTLGALLWLCLHVLAWTAIRATVDDVMPPAVYLYGGVGTLFVATFILSSAISKSISVFFERGDLDLLLASPVAGRTIFTVRCLSVALNIILPWAFFLTPFAHMGLVAGRPSLIAIYPALMAIGLLFAAIGVNLTLLLVHWLGARRARVTIQLIAALTGAGFFLAIQAHNFLSPASQQAIAAAIGRLRQDGGLLAPDSMLWLPFRALLGEPLPLLSLCVLGFGLFWLAAHLSQRAFIGGLQATVGVTPSPLRQVRTRRMFQQSLGMTIIGKEWKLIARDPHLITQTLLQVLYMMPLVFVANRGKVHAAVIPAAVMLAAGLAGSLCNLTVAAEDAPELIAAAPVSLPRIRWIKICAALIPVWLLTTPLLMFYLLTHAADGLVLLACTVGATLSAGMVQIWHPRVRDRKSMTHGIAKLEWQTLIETFSSLAWAGCAYALLQYPLLLLLFLPLAIIGPLGAWAAGNYRQRD